MKRALFGTTALVAAGALLAPAAQAEEGIKLGLGGYMNNFFGVGDVDNDEAFAEVETGFSEEDALREAGRCLMCRCQAAGVCILQSLSIEYGAGTKTYLGKEAWK